MIEEKQAEGLTYLCAYPDGFSAEKRYPLVIFLHGAGTRAETTEILHRNVSFRNIVSRQNQHGYVAIAPLCRVNNWNEVMANLIRLIGAMRALPYIDSARVYLTGNSMGGYGTWELAALRADWFAAAMPLCGGGIAWMAGNLKNVPIRAFHGLRDTVVDPIESMQMAKAVNRKGGHAELILFPELDHNCWERVYGTDENYDWLLSFTNERDHAEAEKLSGASFG